VIMVVESVVAVPASHPTAVDRPASRPLFFAVLSLARVDDGWTSSLFSVRRPNAAWTPVDPAGPGRARQKIDGIVFRASSEIIRSIDPKRRATGAAAQSRRAARPSTQFLPFLVAG